MTGVRDCFYGAAEVLRETDYADACPIETLALEVASTNEPLRIATAEVFESWLDGWEHCTTVWDILSGAVAARDQVIVYDGTGRHQAVSCALHLADHPLRDRRATGEVRPAAGVGSRAASRSRRGEPSAAVRSR